MGAKLGLDADSRYLGIWGFFQVRREYREHGIGTIICDFVDDHVQHYTNATESEQLVYLFTSEPHAMKLYQRVGFEAQDATVNLPAFGITETLFKKTYKPF